MNKIDNDVENQQYISIRKSTLIRIIAAAVLGSVFLMLLIVEIKINTPFYDELFKQNVQHIFFSSSMYIVVLSIITNIIGIIIGKRKDR